MNRRFFLRDSAIAVAGAGAAPPWLLRAAQTPARRRKVLVAVFQRGAADGLNIVVPFREERYYSLRPTIAVAQKEVLDLDGRFGLHPSLAPFKPIWEARALAIVHAAGSPDPTRSHFDAQDYMESGTPGLKATRDGWMNRVLAAEKEASPVRAVALAAQLPRSLRGRQAAVSIGNLAEFQVRDAEAAGTFETLYTRTKDPLLRPAGRETFEVVASLRSISKQPSAPAADYPRSRFAESLRQIAQLIKADAGLELAFAEIGGWDHHANEAAQLSTLLGEYGGALAAFWRDLGDRMEDVMVVTMSEFGRTAHENGSRGTDHGHANVMFAIGGGAAGGRVHGRWPGLEREQLYEGRDLEMTTDFRDVLGEVVARHLGHRELEAVFPGHRPVFPGVVG